ncbi:MAG: twin-arginine translocase subunit TatC [Planctomycetia bacterium]|nr:twin-arginine translocase subunit TatC [Planctomycetia bacterium]
MVDRDEDDLFKHTSMTFGEHLEELRGSLFKAVLSIAIGFGIGLWFGEDVVKLIQVPLEKALRQHYSTDAIERFNERVPAEMRNDPAIKKLVFEEGLVPQEAFVAPSDMLNELKKKYPKAFGELELPRADAKQNLTKDDLIRVFLWRPMSDDERLKLGSFNVQEPFITYIKASFISGLVFASPFAFYFLWSFVAAGLYPHEKKYVHLFLPISVGLFLCGALMAFIFVFPPVLNFFFGISKSLNQDMHPRISEWLSFVLLLPICFGISFQLPLVMLFLERIRIFTIQNYLSKWRIAVLVMAFASMVLSPGGDPISMMMMLVPLVALYFGGILLCKWLPSPGERATRQSDVKAYAATD